MNEEKHSFAVPVAIGAVIVLLLVVAGAYLLDRSSTGSTAEDRLPFGAREQAAAGRIRFVDIKLSRAANFLEQEVTFITGSVENAGTEDVRQIEVQMEFFNLLNQVVLRQSRRLDWRKTTALPGSFSREFEFTLEFLPHDWNQHAPTFRITGLALEP